MEVVYPMENHYFEVLVRTYSAGKTYTYVVFWCRSMLVFPSMVNSDRDFKVVVWIYDFHMVT